MAEYTYTAPSHTVRLAIRCSALRERMACGERRLVRLSALLRRVDAQSARTSVLQNAVDRMARGYKLSTTSVDLIRRVMAKVTHHLGKQKQQFCLADEEARIRAKGVLEMLGE
jgi:hypothetical protein